LGDTERDPTDSDPRVPISTNRYDYEFSEVYFEKASLQEANASNNGGRFKIKQNYSDYLTYPDDSDRVDTTGGTRRTGVRGLLGKMFGYKPSQLADAYFVKYKDRNIQGGDTLVKGENPILFVPTENNGIIKAPDTGYEIAPGYGAMVAYASPTSITMHIGRHEYFAGTGQNNCHGLPCSGGYWITISNVCVDTKILNAYNSVSGRQGQVGTNIVTDTLQLPMLNNGAPIARTNGSPARVIVRDNGPIISAYKPFYWEGVAVLTITPTNGTPTNTPAANATATPTVPPGTTPTITPRTTPTLPPCDMSGTSCQEGCDTGYRCSSTLCIQNGRYRSICIQNSNLTPTPTVSTTGTATPSATRTPTPPSNTPAPDATATPISPTATVAPAATVMPGVTPNITPGANQIKIGFNLSTNPLFQIIKENADSRERSYVYYSLFNNSDTPIINDGIYSCNISAITCTYFFGSPLPFDNISVLDRLYITFGFSGTEYHLIQPR
jgi:hypothetical protein